MEEEAAELKPHLHGSIAKRDSRFHFQRMSLFCTLLQVLLLFRRDDLFVSSDLNAISEGLPCKHLEFVQMEESSRSMSIKSLHRLTGELQNFQEIVKHIIAPFG